MRNAKLITTIIVTTLTMTSLVPYRKNSGLVETPQLCAYDRLLSLLS